MLHVAIDSELTGLPERAKPSEEEDRMNDMKKLIEIMALALEIWIERMEIILPGKRKKNRRKNRKKQKTLSGKNLNQRPPALISRPTFDIITSDLDRLFNGRLLTVVDEALLC